MTGDLADMRQRFLGKVVVVTGASQGIGAATAERFAAEGAAVACLSRSRDLLLDLQARMVAAGGSCLALPTDVAVPDQVQAAFDQIATQLGAVDIVVNNAGAVVNVPFAAMTLAQWDQVQNTNVRGLMLCCQQAFRQMDGRGGVIVNIASLSGVKNVEKFPGLSAYVASKFAVVGLSEALAVEGRPLGIRVVTVSPGAVDTPMLRAAAPQLRPGMVPADMAEIITWLASDAGRHLSGTNLEIFSNE